MSHNLINQSLSAYHSVADFQELYPDSIVSTKVGWMSPNPKKHEEYPPIDVVHGGPTADGYVEVCEVELADPETHFERLIKFFFSFHDSTADKASNKFSGEGKGKEYSSFIFCTDEAQAKIATQIRGELQGLLDTKAVKVFSGHKVLTKIGPATMFFPAPADHQNYLEKYPLRKLDQKIFLKEWPGTVKQ